MTVFFTESRTRDVRRDDSLACDETLVLESISLLRLPFAGCLKMCVCLGPFGEGAMGRRGEKRREEKRREERKVLGW